MIGHRPRLSVARPDPDARAHLGGVPIGLPADRWPTCAQCRRPMAHLAQLPPVSGVLATPGDGTFFLFLCQHVEPATICDFWDGSSGANAVLLVPPDELGPEPTPAPDGATVLAEVWVTGWEEVDDGVPSELDAQRYDQGFWDLPYEIQHPFDFDPLVRTKVGGAPIWTANGTVGLPDPAARVVAQVDSTLAPEDPVEAVRPAVEGRLYAEVSVDEGRTWLSIANLCLDGTAYLLAMPDGSHRLDIWR